MLQIAMLERLLGKGFRFPQKLFYYIIRKIRNAFACNLYCRK